MEQGGIYKIELIENVGISYLYPQVSDARQIYSFISSGGRRVTLDFCNKITVTQNVRRGANGKSVYSYNIPFSLFDLTESTQNQIEELQSNVGWVAILHLNKGTKMFIPAPLILGDGTFDELTGNNYTFNLSNEVESLLPFWRVTDIAPTDLIIDIDNTFLIDADGSFMFEPI